MPEQAPGGIYPPRFKTSYDKDKSDMIASMLQSVPDVSVLGDGAAIGQCLDSDHAKLVLTHGHPQTAQQSSRYFNLERGILQSLPLRHRTERLGTFDHQYLRLLLIARCHVMGSLGCGFW